MKIFICFIATFLGSMVYSQTITDVRVVPVSSTEVKIEVDINNTSSFFIQGNETELGTDSVWISTCYRKTLQTVETDTTLSFNILLGTDPKWYYINYDLNYYFSAFGADTCGGTESYTNSESLNFFHPSSDTAFLKLEERSDFSDYQIYPNPTEGQFHLRLPASSSLKYFIVSIEGRILHTDIRESSTDHLDLLPPHLLESGTYWIEFRSDQNNFGRKAFVVR